jgi:hypothetical protein
VVARGELVVALWVLAFLALEGEEREEEKGARSSREADDESVVFW